MDGTPPEGEEQRGSPTGAAVRLDALGQLIRAKRQAEQLTLEKAAQQSGVSAATLSRWERHYAGGTHSAAGVPVTPDTRTLAALTRWLGVSLERIMRIDTPLPAQTRSHLERETTPDIVAAHLRADRNLDSHTAEALGRLFRSAYEQFASLSKSIEEPGDTSPAGDPQVTRATETRHHEDADE